MKYLLILYANYNDEKADKKAMYELSSATEAVASFHSYLGTYMKDETVAHVMVMAIDANGMVVKKESFDR